MIHEKEERSLIIVKPDGVQRNLVGKVITRFEEKGLKIIGMKMLHLEDAIVEAHYEHLKEKPFFPQIKKYIQSAPVVVFAVAGINAIEAIRVIVGITAGYAADAGTIRGDYSLSKQSNIVHASDSKESGEKEIPRFFSAEELVEYDKIDTTFIFTDDLL